MCDNNYQITVDYKDTAIVDIPVEAITECAELQVNVGVRTPIFRRCFDNAFAVNYCNLGTTNEDNVNVEVIIDDWLQVDSFESPIIQENFNGRQRFIIPSTQLEIGECNTSLIHFTPICDAPLGISQCIKAHITPDSLCSALSSTWTGPTIETDTRCNNVGQVALTLRNVGKSIAEDLTYKIYKDGVVVDEVTFSLIPNEFLTIVKNNDNSSWGIECKQVENHPCGVIARSFIEGCGIAPNTITNSFALQFPNDNALCPFNDEICSPIIGSYDPNDKQAFPVGYGSEHYVTPETTIEYLIRFQNVGNDTAFNIFITDSLSSYLDLTSLEILESSHPYQLQIDTNQVMTFSFFDALLVDSVANEPESHGFISYKIGFKADTPLETVVKNKAYIVFDFNDPIITNEVFHTLGRDFIQSDISSVISKSDILELKVYPNPATDQITIDLNDIQLDWLRIIDITGREVLREFKLTGNSKINIDHLKAGVYMLEGKGYQGEKYSDKIIKL